MSNEPVNVTTPDSVPEKIVIEYQATDESGQPIGRPTRIVADSYQDALEKQKQAHIEATRAYFRVKNAKPDPKRPRAEFNPAPGTDDDRARFRKNFEAEVGASIEAVRGALQLADGLDAKFEVDTFLAAHGGKDYFPCPQNQTAMVKFLEDNQYEVTAKNLEIALEALNLKGELLPVPQPTQSVPPAPVESEPPAPAAPRPSASGVMPGQFSSNRVPLKSGLTKQDIAKMTPADYRKALRNPAQRAEIERVLGQS